MHWKTKSISSLKGYLPASAILQIVLVAKDINCLKGYLNLAQGKRSGTLGYVIGIRLIIKDL